MREEHGGGDTLTAGEVEDSLRGTHRDKQEHTRINRNTQEHTVTHKDTQKQHRTQRDTASMRRGKVPEVGLLLLAYQLCSR